MLNRNTLLVEGHRFLTDMKSSQQSYLGFLDTMSRFHKYSLMQQVNLYHHAPASSTAVATAETWKKLGRTVSPNAREIPILMGERNREVMETVYDISDTVKEQNSRTDVLPWKFDEERHQAYLDEHFPGEGNVVERVRKACEALTDGWTEDNKDVIGLSVAYVVLTRMGYDTEDLAVEMAMMPWQIENPEQVLTTVNRLSGQVLNPMGAYIRKESEKNNERSREGTDGGGRGEPQDQVAGNVRVVPDALPDNGENRAVEETLGIGEGGAVPEGLRGEVLGEVRSNNRSDGEEDGVTLELKQQNVMEWISRAQYCQQAAMELMMKEIQS